MICIIPARGQSQRIPRKNIKEFLGVPIIEYSINVAVESGLFDHIYVTTEDAEIAEVARKAGATVYMRPDELAVNEVGSQAVARDLLNNVDTGDAEYACVIYATAPLLTIKDLDFGYYKLRGSRSYDYIYSCNDEGVDIGNYYWGKIESFKAGVPLLGNSMAVAIDAIDINTMSDWNLAEAMYEERQNGH